MHIVTGKINGGKTTTLYDLYHKQQQGDGFISVKRMHYDQVHGYDLMRLSDGKTIPFVIHVARHTDNEEIACQIGPYKFYKTALDQVQSQVEKWIANNITPIYLDEIGGLELSEKGFHHTLMTCIKQGVEVYVTVREDLIDDVVKKYQPSNIDIIPV
jgi:nucleoside-triphosphatase THEP1